MAITFCPTRQSDARAGAGTSGQLRIHLIPDDGSADIFLDQRQMGKVLHGDRALVRVVGVDRKGTPGGQHRRSHRAVNTRLVGQVFVEHGVVFVVPENKRISQDVLVPPDKKAKFKAESGQVVMVEIVEQPSKHSSRSVASLSKCWATTPIPAWKSRSRCASTICPFEFSKAALERNKRCRSRSAKWTSTREDIRRCRW